jgi:hypothetical protein
MQGSALRLVLVLGLLLALAGCGDGTTASEAPEEVAAVDGASDGGAGGDDAAEGGGAATAAPAPAGLEAGVCPVDADAVSRATGVDMHVDADADCVFRGPDGVELVTVRVSTAYLDGRLAHENQGFEVVDLAVGEDSYLAMREVEAVAESVYGDLLLSAGMAGLEADETRWRELGTALLEAATSG